MSLPKPYYEDEWAALYLGDCLEVMAGLRAGSIDAVVTDPPYFLPAEHYSTRKEWPRSLADLSILEHFFRDVFAECRRVLKPNGAALVFCDGQSFPVFYALSYRLFDRLSDLVWDKGSIGMGKGIRRQHELILACLPASFDWQGWTRSVLPYPPVGSGDRLHPAEKPLALLGHLVRLAVPADGVVLDPFAGSGATGVAAVQQGRRAVLAECEPEYAEIAARRLAQEVIRFPEASRESKAEQVSLPGLD